MIKIVEKKKIWFSISLTVILVGLVLTIWFYKDEYNEIVETLNKQLDVVSEAVGSYLKAQEGSYEEINRLLKISCLSNNMDGIIVDRLGYIYMVSNEEYANLKYTNIDITEYNIPNSNELEYRKNLIKDYFNEDLSAFIKPIFLDEMSEKYWEKPEFKKLLDHANSLDNLLEQQFDCVYLAGGHGAMYDFPDNEALKTIVRKQDESGRIVSAICHGVSGLLNVKLSNGEYMIKGKKLTGFSWFEESLARRKEDVPFDLEALLKERGADYEKALIPMTSKVVVDNNLITGQDPFSSKEMAKVVMRQLNKAQ